MSHCTLFRVQVGSNTISYHYTGFVGVLWEQFEIPELIFQSLHMKLVDPTTELIRYPMDAIMRLTYDRQLLNALKGKRVNPGSYGP
jgi:hypothetical protein